jgi:tetratricopeptide (TPR) repeat protein
LGNRANIYTEQGKYDEAMIAYNETIKKVPDSAWGYLHRGLLYYQMNQPEQALSDVSKAIDLAPKSGRVYYLRGAIYEKLNRMAEAQADVVRARQLGFDPKNGVEKDEKSLLDVNLYNYEKDHNPFTVYDAIAVQGNIR